MNANSDIRIRIANQEDAPALLAIYAPYVKKTAITFAYSVPAIHKFAAHIQKIQEKYPYLVAENDEEILGYTYAGPFHERAAYAWAVETSIYIKEDQKRKGIGAKLYTALENILAAQNILNLNACIAYLDEEDAYLTLDSVRFHARWGYRMVGKFNQCGYKFNRWYDMVWMEKHIGPHIANPPQVKTFQEIKPFIKSIQQDS